MRRQQQTYEAFKGLILAIQAPPLLWYAHMPRENSGFENKVWNSPDQLGIVSVIKGGLPQPILQAKKRVPCPTHHHCKVYLHPQNLMV